MQRGAKGQGVQGDKNPKDPGVLLTGAQQPIAGAPVVLGPAEREEEVRPLESDNPSSHRQ